MAEAGTDTAAWKANSLRGAAATHFLAKGVPGAVVQEKGCWASAATRAAHYARQHQLIPWAELALSTPDLHLGSGEIAYSSCSALPRTSLQSLSQISRGAKYRDHCWMVKIVKDEWCGQMSPFLSRLRKKKGGDRGTQPSARTIIGR